METRVKREAIIVSRHAATIEWLREQGFVGRVLEHATEEDVADQIVVGNLPLHLAAATWVIGGVEFSVSAEMRGQEMTLEYLRENAQVRWYAVGSGGVSPTAAHHLWAAMMHA